MLELQAITFKEASNFIQIHHRHHIPSRGWKYGVGINDGNNLVGVIIVGRPVSRHLDNGEILEVTRCCTNGTKNACSKLYSTAKKICKLLGYKKLITYTLDSESGTSLKASGWEITHKTKGLSWNTPSRARTDKHPLLDKFRWEVNL